MSRRLCYFFFFSSRRRHTRYIGDWSSDVCSSDLRPWSSSYSGPTPFVSATYSATCARSEERRVGKSVDLGGRRIIKKKKRQKTRQRRSLIRTTTRLQIRQTMHHRP